MYAIIRIGNRQYVAEPGKTIVTEKLNYDVGDKLTVDDVLLVKNGGDAQVGTPIVGGASVTAEVVDQFKGKKIIVFKYKKKNRYRRKQGHRQNYTRLLIKDITV